MDLSRRARAAVFYAALSGMVVIGMAGTASAFTDHAPELPRHALPVPTTPQTVASTAPVPTAADPTPATSAPARRTPRPTSGPTPTVPATVPCASPGCGDADTGTDPRDVSVRMSLPLGGAIAIDVPIR